MQNILVEKPYKYSPPYRGTLIPTLVRTTGLFARHLRKSEGVVAHEVRNAGLLRKSIEAGHGILLAPNHSRTADPIVMGYLCRKVPCLAYAMASWHLFNQGAFYRFAIRYLGGFSINREGIDRQSIDEAISILDSGERPLVIFPEGTTSRTNDRLMPMLEGVSFIARAAAKRREKAGRGKVVVHPIAIKYVFGGDIHATSKPILADIERRLTWRPQTDKPLMTRLAKIGEALLTLKELDTFGEIQTGTLPERQENLIERLLSPLEAEWLGRSCEKHAGVVARIKALRMKMLPGMTHGEVTTRERARRVRQFEDTYLAQQVYCYPENYLAEPTTVDRVLETVERFEEDLTDKAHVHGHLKVIIDVDEAIEVDPKRNRSASPDPLMESIRERLQIKLDALASESRVFHEEGE